MSKPNSKWKLYRDKLKLKEEVLQQYIFLLDEYRKENSELKQKIKRLENSNKI